jgi:MFS family permease
MLRWEIALLVAIAIAISYLDRQALPVAIQAIARDIPVTNEQFSQLQSAFLIAYAFMYVGGGKLMDVLGTRRGFTVIMVFWSLACASHGLAVSVGTLALSRFLLGIGEGGGFPAATRAVAEWFPVQERSTAMGIINAGTVGMVVTAAHRRNRAVCRLAMGLSRAALLGLSDCVVVGVPRPPAEHRGLPVAGARSPAKSSSTPAPSPAIRG